MQKSYGQRAVVIGGSITGMLSARVLAEFSMKSLFLKPMMFIMTRMLESVYHKVTTHMSSYKADSRHWNECSLTLLMN